MKRTNDQTLQQALRYMVEVYKLRPKLNETKIKSLWEKLMGPTIHGYTRNIYVHSGCLYLQIDSFAVKQELTFSKQKLITMLNKELGEDFIKDVFIR